MINILVHIQSTGNIIGSFSAIKQLHEKGNINVTYLIYNPGLNKDILKEVITVTQNLLHIFPEIKQIHYLTPKSNPLNDNVNKLYINKQFDEIYYAHDFLTSFQNHLYDLFPNANYVCYGDALGIAYEKKLYMSFLLKKDNLLVKFKKIALLLKIFITFHDNNEKEADSPIIKYALAIPIDHGNLLNAQNLTVINKETLINIINKMNLGFKDIADYSNHLVNTYKDKPKYLILTENNAEGNFIDLDKEIEMYSWIIQNNCPKGSVIYIKSHPLETMPRNDLLKKRLNKDFIIEIIDPKFKRYPIELWIDLINSCKIICMSYPVLSLKYLYNSDVIQPMDKKFIKTWFPKQFQRSYEMAMELYMKPLKRLKHWDGKSVLWKK